MTWIVLRYGNKYTHEHFTVGTSWQNCTWCSAIPGTAITEGLVQNGRVGVGMWDSSLLPVLHHRLSKILSHIKLLYSQEYTQKMGSKFSICTCVRGSGCTSINLTIVSRKKAHGPYTYFVLRQGGGRIFATSVHFTMKMHPCLQYHNLQQDIAPGG